MEKKNHSPLEVAKAILLKYSELLQKAEPKHEDKKEDEKLIEQKLEEHDKKEEKCEECKDKKECECAPKIEKSEEDMKLKKFMSWREEKKNKK